MKTIIKDSIIALESGRLEVYTPQDYLGSVNNIRGNEIVIMGLVPYKYYNKASDTKPAKVGILNRPTMLTMYPTDIEQNVKDGIWDGVYKDFTVKEYTRLTFTEKHDIMDRYTVKSLDNVSTFTELLLGGALDNNIPYTMLSETWIKNMIMNDVNLSVSGTVVNLIIREMCRSKHDNSIQFAKVIGKDPKVSPVAYTFGNFRQICASNSVFTAIAFEDMNSMLDASLNMTKKEKEQKISPIEQTIKM